jgi:hypothetical protein
MKRIGQRSATRIGVVVASTAMLMTLGVGEAIAATTPPNAITGRVSAILPTSVTVSGTVNAEGTATTWYFQYGLQTDSLYGAQTPSISAGSGVGNVAVRHSLAGLSPATSYHFRVVAISSIRTTYGADVSFHTSAAPAVATGPATAITTTTATLNGTVNPEALATSWYFQYGPTTSYGGKTAVGKIAAGPNNVAVASRVTKFVPNSTYHYRLVAVSGAGTTIGADLVLTTGLTITLSTSNPTAIYGGTVYLFGAITDGTVGEHITLMAEAFDQTSFSAIATITSGNGGTWNYSAQPNARTTYEASITSGMSSPLVVSISPSVSLKTVSGGRLSTRVLGQISFAGHVLQLQRLSGNLWVTWKHVRLNSNGQISFATALPKGRTKIRMAIGPFVAGIDQAAPGYLAGYSRTITYTR